MLFLLNAKHPPYVFVVLFFFNLREQFFLVGFTLQKFKKEMKVQRLVIYFF
jgi:hypothetical protein